MSPAPSVTKILLLAADPGNEARLRLGREIQAIRESWRQSRLRDQYVLDDNLATRPGSLRQAMLEARPAIVHFCGHGSGPDGLVLEDNQGQGKLVATDALAGLFQLSEGQVQGVVLNSCHSAAQAEEIVRFVPYVIGMSREIGDDAAIHFSCGFYDALFAGEPIERAFEFGCSAIHLESLPDGIRGGLPARDLRPADGGVVGALPEHLRPVLLVRADAFIRCHPNDDPRVKGELAEPLGRAGLRVTGDWRFRGAGATRAAYDVTLRISRHVLVVWTPDWCRAAAPPVGPGTNSAIDPGDRRVRVLLWEGPPSDGLPGVAVYDFRQPPQRADALTRLLNDLGVPAGAVSKVQAQSARRVFEVLRDFMQTDQVRDAVGLVRTTLTRARDDIGELNRWKQLHDLLHGLSVPFPLFVERVELLKKTLTVPVEGPPEDQQRAVDGCWRKVRQDVNLRVLPPLRVLVAFAGPPAFQPAEVPLVRTLQIAQERLEAGCRDRDPRALRRGVELVGPVLGQWMTSVDQLLFVTAHRVPLATLVQALETVGQTLDGLEFTGAAADRVGEFKRGVVALRQLHVRLESLVSTHTWLQTIDSLTSQLEYSEVTAEEIETAWQGVLPTVALAGCGADGDWLGDLCRQCAEVDRAVPRDPGGEPDARALSRLRDAFSDFRSQLVSGFLLADQTLKKFCEDLQEIRESLSRALEGIQP